MTTRREFLQGVGGGIAGGWLWRTVPLGLGAAGLSLATPRPAAASPGVVLDPNNPQANFTKEGNQLFTPGPVLVLSDASGADIINFFAGDADAARGVSTDVVVRFQITRTVPNNADNGVRFAINDGQQRAVIAACITKNGQRGIGLAAGDIFADPNNYPDQAFVQVDWGVAVRELRIRRHATGEAEIVSVDGIPPPTRKFLLDGQLASAFRPQPTVEFGCRTREAEADLEIHAFRSERSGVVSGTLSNIDLRIRDSSSNDRVRLRCEFALGAFSDGIDPGNEPVRIKMSTPAGQFYPPPTADYNPVNNFDVQGQPPRRKWSISAAESVRTQLERFDIEERGQITLRDATENIPEISFAVVSIDFSVGNDRFNAVVNLVEDPLGSGHWRSA
jgi:hypothetical protein